MKESKYGIAGDRNIFRETFESEQNTRRLGGTPTAVTYSNGVGSFNGTSSYSLYKINLNGTYTVRMKFKSITSLTGFAHLSDFRTPAFVGSGTLYVNGNILNTSSGTIYVNGTAGSTISTSTKEIIISGMTISSIGLTLCARSDLSLKGAFDIDLVEIYTGTLTASEVKNLYDKDTYRPLTAQQKQQLGSELITNGSFDTDTGWTKGTGWTISGGTANANVVTGQYLSQLSGITPNKRYKYSFEVKNYSSGTVRLGDSTVAWQAATANGIYTGEILTGSGATAGISYFSPLTSFVGSIDNVTIKEILVEEHQEVLNIDPRLGTISNKYTGSIGPELHTNANAASDPNGNESDATTGFTQVGLDAGSNVFASQSNVVSFGTYAIEANANNTPTSGARFYVDLEASPFNFINGKKYKILFDSRHIGSGDLWVFRTSSSNNFATDPVNRRVLTNIDTSFVSTEFEITHSSTTRYFGATELSATNNGGVYFDNFSVKEITQDVTNTAVTIKKSGQFNIMDFVAGSSYLTLGTPVSLSSGVTAWAWVKSSDTITSHICFCQELTNDRGFKTINGANPLIYLGGLNYKYFIDSSNRWKDGKRHLWVWQVTGTAQTDINNSKMWIDGVELSAGITIATAVATITTIKYISSNYAGHSCNQQIGMNGIYQGLLSQESITQLYTSTKNNYL